MPLAWILTVWNLAKRLEVIITMSIKAKKPPVDDDEDGRPASTDEVIEGETFEEYWHRGNKDDDAAGREQKLTKKQWDDLESTDPNMGAL